MAFFILHKYYIYALISKRKFIFTYIKILFYFSRSVPADYIFNKMIENLYDVKKLDRVNHLILQYIHRFFAAFILLFIFTKLFLRSYLFQLSLFIRVSTNNFEFEDKIYQRRQKIRAQKTSFDTFSEKTRLFK